MEPQTERPTKAQWNDPQHLSVPNEAYYQQQAKPPVQRWGKALIVIGIVWLLIELTTRSTIMGFGLGLSEAKETLRPLNFSAEHVVVNLSNGDVRIEGWDNDEVEVTATVYGFGWNRDAAEQFIRDIEITTRSQGDTIYIEVEQPALPVMGRAPKVDLQINLPSDTKIDLTLTNGDVRIEESQFTDSSAITTINGDIVVSESSGNLSVATTNGDIEIEDHSGELRVTATNGAVAVNGEALTGLTVDTVNADIVAEQVSGAIDLKTINGDIQLSDMERGVVQLNTTSGDISVSGGFAESGTSTISTISGDVDIEIADDPGLSLDISTLSGDIEHDLDLDGVREERRSLTGKTGDGAATLNVNTTSGDIQIQ